jgi:hypothetical protein
MSYTITGSDDLLRRIIRQPQFFKEVDGIRKASSAAFKLKSGEDGLSVDIMALTSLGKAIANPVTHTGAVLSAQVPLNLSLPCVHDPITGNEAHALIKNVTSSLAKQLAKNAVLI